MQKQTTNIFNCLVIAQANADGSIDLNSIQPLDDWNRGNRKLELLSHGYGLSLLDILTSELGLVDVNDEGMLSSKIIITQDSNNSVMRLLGKIAEALIPESVAQKLSDVEII